MILVAAFSFALGVLATVVAGERDRKRPIAVYRAQDSTLPKGYR